MLFKVNVRKAVSATYVLNVSDVHVDRYGKVASNADNSEVDLLKYAKDFPLSVSGYVEAEPKVELMRVEAVLETNKLNKEKFNEF